VALLVLTGEDKTWGKTLRGKSAQVKVLNYVKQENNIPALPSDQIQMMSEDHVTSYPIPLHSFLPKRVSPRARLGSSTPQLHGSCMPFAA
jgi:hypothetical protein